MSPRTEMRNGFRCQAALGGWLGWTERSFNLLLSQSPDTFIPRLQSGHSCWIGIMLTASHNQKKEAPIVGPAPMLPRVITSCVRFSHSLTPHTTIILIESHIIASAKTSHITWVVYFPFLLAPECMHSLQVVCARSLHTPLGM